MQTEHYKNLKEENEIDHNELELLLKDLWNKRDSTNFWFRLEWVE